MLCRAWATLCGVFTALMATAPALAQYTIPSPNLQIITNQVGNEAFRQSVINPPVEADTLRSSTPDQQVPNASPKHDAAALRFVPNIGLRQHNLVQFVARTREQSPVNADQMARLFASPDIFTLFTTSLAPKALRIDNVADAYVVYWITAWEASRGIFGRDNSPTQVQGVKAQVSRALLSAPNFINSSPAQKQELAEALLIQTALISASADAAANDPAQLHAVGNAVRQAQKPWGWILMLWCWAKPGLCRAANDRENRSGIVRGTRPSRWHTGRCVVATAN